MRSASILLLLAVTLVASSCSNPARPDPIEEPSAPNTLTAAERAQGWRLLFDGRTTAGWRGFRQSSIPSGWQVIDGALTRAAGGSDIVTQDQFENFELMIEWQIAPRGNSGIMFRVSEAADAPHLTGPEMQVLDNAGHPDGANPLSQAGACYGLYPPSTDATRAVGSWNLAHIVVSGSDVQHSLNGIRIVSYQLGSSDWLTRWQSGPFRDVPGYGREPRGHIALQDHGDRVAYRSIKIRVL